MQTNTQTQSRCALSPGALGAVIAMLIVCLLGLQTVTKAHELVHPHHEESLLCEVLSGTAVSSDLLAVATYTIRQSALESLKARTANAMLRSVDSYWNHSRAPPSL